MNKIKVFDGLFDSFYKKWELYLFRLFQIARYVESRIKFSRVNEPELNEVLNPEGYENGIIRVPPIPFWLRDDDRKMFMIIYEPLEARSEKEKDMRIFFREVWERMGEVKTFVGITRNTRYIGESIADKRLCNEIDIFMKYPEACSPIYRVVLGDPNNIEVLKSFQKLLKDREPVRGVKSYQQY